MRSSSTFKAPTSYVYPLDGERTSHARVWLLSCHGDPGKVPPSPLTGNASQGNAVVVKHRGPLLILDDRDDVRTGLKRLFGLFFETVLVAATPDEADAHLRETSAPFLLCDYWLGPEHPPGSEVIRRLRRDHPCLERVALMTGSKVSSLTDTRGADAVFPKPLDSKKVRAFFIDGEPPSSHSGDPPAVDG